jgi:hypothetical protein
LRDPNIFDLAHRVALVTGSSSGLGVQFARALAENGAAVVLVARRAERLAELKSEIEFKGGRALAVAADVADRSDMLRAFHSAEKAFGAVTILVNNAGIAHSKRAVDVTEEEWRQQLCPVAAKRPLDLGVLFFFYCIELDEHTFRVIHLCLHISSNQRHWNSHSLRYAAHFPGIISRPPTAGQIEFL